MVLRNRQQGATFFSTMIVLIVAGIFLAVGFKLYPAYYDHYLIKSVVGDVAATPEEVSKPVNEIRNTLSKRLRINQVKLPAKEALKFTRDEGVMTISLKYDVRVPMFFNVDALVKFDEQYEVISR